MRMIIALGLGGLLLAGCAGGPGYYGGGPGYGGQRGGWGRQPSQAEINARGQAQENARGFWGGRYYREHGADPNSLSNQGG